MKSYATLFVLTLLLSGCSAQVKISDAEFCGDMGVEGAQCFNLLSDGERSVPPAQWDYERFGMICTSAQTFVEWKKTIIKLCDVTGRCFYATKEMAEGFADRVQTFSKDLHGEHYEDDERTSGGDG